MNKSEISPFGFLLLTFLGVVIAVSIMRAIGTDSMMSMSIITAVLLVIALGVTLHFFYSQSSKHSTEESQEEE